MTNDAVKEFTCINVPSKDRKFFYTIKVKMLYEKALFQSFFNIQTKLT